MPELRNGWEMVGTQIYQIGSVSEQDSEHLTGGPLVGICWKIARWPMVRQGGYFLL